MTERIEIEIDMFVFVCFSYIYIYKSPRHISCVVAPTEEWGGVNCE